MTDGMEKWQADCNARMSKGNEPGSPAAMLAEIERLTAENEELRCLLRKAGLFCGYRLARQIDQALDQQQAVNSEEGK